MNDLQVIIANVKNGYIITVGDDQHVATSREETAKIIAKVCDDAFRDVGSRSKTEKADE